GVPEELPILGTADCVDPGADQLDPELLEHARPRELECEIEGGLAAERRQKRVGSLALEEGADTLDVERLQVRAVGEAGGGYERRRVRVDDDRAEAVLPQHLQGLAARV